MGKLSRIAIAAVVGSAAAIPGFASAQREIVQPLPPAGSDRLSEALTRLARNAADVSALLDAGEAALDVGDIEAAIGFFGRANQLSPDNSRVALGLAKAYVRSRQPIEALRLFAEAQRAGVSNDRMAEDRAMAFMLVGDNRSAQELFRLALSRAQDPEVQRRLALSLAISGDRQGFEQTLLPLLEARDLAAFRTRAFGLAILGDVREAKGISDAMLPPAMAQRIGPYLEFMPRLTPAQQAAAGSLGVFPRAANIGTDAPQIAAYVAAAPAPPPEPAAAPPPAPAPTQARQAGASVSSPRAVSRATQTRQSTPRSAARAGRETTVGPRSSVTAGIPRDLSPATIEAAQQQQASVQASARPQTQDPAPAPAPAPTPTPAGGSLEAPEAVVVAGPAVTATGELPPVAAARQPEPSAVMVAVAPQSAPPPPPPSPSPAPPTEAVPSLEEAFSSFTLQPSAPQPAAQGAVDITRIEAPRERAVPPPPPPPAHPARHWVQVATGKDRAALGFDWRRIARKADSILDGKGPFVTPWGEANRLLAGPYPDAQSARQIMNDLKALGIDSFTFRSAEGEAIEPLG